MPKTAIAAAVISTVLAGAARAQDRGIELGALECAISGGTGFIFGSTKDLSCTFTPSDKTFAPEAYSAPSTNTASTSARQSKR